MKITLELTDEQIISIVAEELESALKDIIFYKELISEEDREAFERVLGWYKA